MGKEDTYDYKYLLQKGYTIEQLCNRYQFWYGQMLCFLKNAGLEGKVRIDRRKLGYAVLSYFADIHRLKEFHGIDKTNLAKIYGYEVYWILRMSPLQLMDATDDKMLWVNEKFAVTVLISSLLNSIKMKECDPKTNPALKEFADLLYYSFKYRNYHSQSLELAIKGFMVGAEIRG